LPDLAAFTIGVPESCSPVAFAVNPAQLDCATKDQSPQTYRSANGPAQYLLKRFHNLHGAFLYSIDTKDAERASRVLDDAQVAAGIKADQMTGLSARAEQTAYTPMVGSMKQSGSNFGFTPNSGPMVNLRSEAQLQGLSSDIVWMCPCSAQADAANSALDGTWVYTTALPFKEGSSNPMLRNFLRYVGKENADSFAVYAWGATLAFADAARAVVEKHGINGLTRKALLSEGIPTLKAFDAGGMIGAVDIPGKVASTCFVMMKIENSDFKRGYPSKKGTFDCNPKYAVTTKGDYIGG
jgi:hypothetical protein